jgi:hypothetical protein
VELVWCTEQVLLLLLLLQGTSPSKVSPTKASPQPSSKQQWQTYRHTSAAASAASLLLRSRTIQHSGQPRSSC